MMLQIVGCSHHQSSIDVRERLAFNEEQAALFLQNFYAAFPKSEAVLLSTCNRTEFYAASKTPDTNPSSNEMKTLLADACGLTYTEINPFLFDHRDTDAIRHLFSVAASLDSMVVGESQILAQVKRAYSLASSLNGKMPLTHQIFQAAIKVAKRVATETNIHSNRVSIPSIAIGDFARQVFERLDNKRILVIGAGEMAEETLNYVSYYGGRDIAIINRTRDTAAELSNRCGGVVLDWIDLPNQLTASDMVISTTGSTEPIVTDDLYREIVVTRQGRPLFVLDLAIPRDFEPRIGDHENVYLYSIDDLQAQCEYNRKSRQSYWPKAKKIIDQETEIFVKEMIHRSKGPTIARLKNQAAQVKDAELQRLMNKLGDIPEQHREEIEVAFHRLTNKLLHPPLESLREESEESENHQLFEAIKQLFKLD